MTKDEIMELQRQLANAGFYEGLIDGLWGPMSEAAMKASMSAAQLRKEQCVPSQPVTSGNGMVVAWGARVSRTFIDRVIWIQQNLGMPSEGVNWLMACMAWESAESFSPSIVNMAGSGAVGLIQFMPRTAIGLGTSSEELARMSAEDQLNYVYRYFLPYKGRLRNLGDVYMAILWPAGIGKADDWTLWDRNKRPTTYRQNAGLDLNKDGLVTRSECLAKIREKYNRGLSTEFRAVI